MNYRDVFEEWAGYLDGIVANGSLEHFAQLDDALHDRVDGVYQELFAICRRLLSPGKRFVTTAIHFREPRQFRAEDIARGPQAWTVGSDKYHFAMIQQEFGGWYPEPRQLERCASPHFRLVHAEDGTEDYRRTSEFWLHQLRRALATRPRVWGQLWAMWRRQPKPLRGMIRCLIWDQSWMWQFRGQPAPMQLWRQTWEAA
jgi:cyclopropane fatty-acyl-phospholipid synthase-like methyltransferase